MPTESATTREMLLASLSIQALRQNVHTSALHPLGFRVASASMRPLFNKDDTIQIVPARADDVRYGEIIAFDTPEGLLVHRLLHCEQQEGTIRLLQSGDGALQAGWLEAETVVGRVIALCPAHNKKQTILLHTPLARWGGYAIASVRYQLYLHKTLPVLSQCLRACSRLLRSLNRWYLYHYCVQADINT